MAIEKHTQKGHELQLALMRFEMEIESMETYPVHIFKKVGALKDAMHRQIHGRTKVQQTVKRIESDWNSLSPTL